MISVVDYGNSDLNKVFILSELTKNNYSDERNAFIGRVGDDDVDNLFIVTYDRISIAESPEETWDNPKCDFTVKRFVDLKITVVEKDV